MKKIQLSQNGKNKGKYVALVDDEDYKYLNQWRWCVQNNPNTCYAIRTQSYPTHKTIRMHKLIMNSPCEKEIDHKDRNGLNNQKSNLRICTHSENQKNKKARGSSKYLGVSRCVENNKLKIKARININGKNNLIGYYKDEKSAAIAYDNAARKHHGEFANLNFPNLYPIPGPEENMKIEFE